MALGDCGSCLAWHNLSQQGTARPGCCKEAYEPPRGCLSRQEACSCASFSWLPQPHSLRCSFSGWGGPASPPPCLPPPHLRGSGCKDVPSRGPWGQAEGLSEPSLLLGRYLGKEGKAIGVAEHCRASPCPLTGLSVRSSPAAGRCGGTEVAQETQTKWGAPSCPQPAHHHHGAPSLLPATAQSPCTHFTPGCSARSTSSSPSHGEETPRQFGEHTLPCHWRGPRDPLLPSLPW